jgi:glycosyltransferase involved in cell wall biosynthesis
MPNVIFAVNSLGIGGTERGMTTQVLAMDLEHFTVRIVGVFDSGPQKAVLEHAGLRVDVGHGQFDTLVDLVRGADVVVHLRQGSAAPLLPSACRHAEVPHFVDWNIFGQVDRSPGEPWFACHLFLSKTMQLRYRRWFDDQSPGFHDRHRVHHLPIDLGLCERALPQADARREFGLDPDRPVVGRTGRAVDVKWRNLLVDMVPALLRAVPDVQLLFVGATPSKVRRLRRLGVLDRCTVIDRMLDEERLAAFYSACDVFVSASEIGEAQGMASLEAMSLGVPVVTCSQPWADNAQVEFVEHGRTGLIANHPQQFAEAVAAVVLDSGFRRQLGSDARETVRRLCEPQAQARQLERLFSSLLTDGRLPSEWTPTPAAVEEFEQEYSRRSRLQYRPLRMRERVEVEAARLREAAARRSQRAIEGVRHGLGVSGARRRSYS